MTRFEQEEEPVEVTGTGNLTISTRDSGRAVRFYERVFGFRVVPEWGNPGTPRVWMHGQGGIALAICEQRGLTTVPRCLLFAAVDLDEARERLWDLGIALADGCIEPRFDPERRCRSLRVRDPDGNGIELVETPVAFAPQEGRGKKVSAVRG